MEILRVNPHIRRDQAGLQKQALEVLAEAVVEYMVTEVVADILVVAEGVPRITVVVNVEVVVDPLIVEITNKIPQLIKQEMEKLK